MTSDQNQERLSRWLVDGRIAVYPRRTADRRALLEYVVAEAIGKDEGLGEPEVNDRLRAFTDDPATLRRYLVDGRIAVYPRRTADRRALLEYVVAEAIGKDEGLGEPEVNDRLRTFTDDPATLRRYLVDHRLLVRSPDGAVYYLP